MEICHRITKLQSRIQKCPYAIEFQALPPSTVYICDFIGTVLCVSLWEAHTVIARFT